MKNKPIYYLFFVLLLVIYLTVFFAIDAYAKPPPIKSKFYDFSEQLIDGHRRKPTILYTNIREKVKFERLLKLKKSFMRQLFNTHKENIFK